MRGINGGNCRFDGERRETMWGVPHIREKIRKGGGAARCWACLAVWLGRALGLVSAPFLFFSSSFLLFFFVFFIILYLLHFNHKRIQINF
jgi:hypothetical protein